tara:strand:+ start:650 stop:997 length:348 start_codon:yes stop_codon:yes gene_type:complete
MFVMLVTVCVAGNLYAGAAAIKARMKARLPQIEALKNQGALGEDNQGYLKVLKKTGNADKLAAEENKDRKLVYTALAKKLKTTPALVGKRRAIQIAQRSPKGQMIQDAAGKWKKK